MFVLGSGWQSSVYTPISLEPQEAEERSKAPGRESGNVKKRLRWGRVSGELRLFGLWEHERNQSSCQQQNRHQQYRNSTVCVHQLSKDDIGRDRRHSAHSGEEAESRGPEHTDVETVQTESTRIDELTLEKCTVAALGRALFPARPENSSRSLTRRWRRRTGSGSGLGSAPGRWGRCSDWTPPGCTLQTRHRTSWKSKHNRFSSASGNKAPFIKLKKGDFHSRHTHTEEFCLLCCPSKGW